MYVLIAEDEPLSATRLQQMTAEELGPMAKFTMVDTVTETVELLLAPEPPDLLLLDIHLADGSSMELFNLVEVKVPVIFTTAYDEHAVAAFRLSAIDYLLKPIKREELGAALEKWKAQRTGKIDYGKLATALQPGKFTRRFLIRAGQQIHLVESKGIDYLTTENRSTILHNRAGRRFVLDQSLDTLERELNPADFYRVNRQFIIHRQAIESMHAYSKARVKIILAGGQETIVSVERSPDFKNWLIEGE